MPEKTDTRTVDEGVAIMAAWGEYFGADPMDTLIVPPDFAAGYRAAKAAAEQHIGEEADYRQKAEGETEVAERERRAAERERDGTRDALAQLVAANGIGHGKRSERNHIRQKAKKDAVAKALAVARAFLSTPSEEER